MIKRTFEIVVASGKGGTGKTTLSGYLLSKFSLENVRVIGVDADVEAPDLVLVLGKYHLIKEEEIYDSFIAEIDYSKCTLCMECIKACRYSAIVLDNKNRPAIIPQICEGCGVCEYICPEGAITMKKVKTGFVQIYETPFSKVVTGELEIGRKHSGHMVEILKEKAHNLAEEKSVIVIDSAAGIGCPVISSIAGSDFLIVVVEPTDQSIYSASRLIEIGKTFRLPIGVVINKFDINLDFLDHIYEWIKSNDLILLGKIPYSKEIVKIYSWGSPLITSLSDDIRKYFDEIYSSLVRELERRELL